MRVRRAALAGDGVDGLHAVRAHLVEALVGQRHDLVLAHAGLERLVDVLVDAVAHGRGHVEQGQLVGVLDHARLEHDLLAVAHLDAFLLEREEEGRLHHVDARSAFPPRPRATRMSLISRAARSKSPDFGDTAPAHADHAGQAMRGLEPGRVEAVMPGRRAEVPHPGLAVAGEEAVADELVARPLADHGAGDVADIVLVEDEEGAQPGAGQRLPRAPEPVGVQPPEVHALLEVHLHVAGRLDGPVPAMPGVRRVGGRVGGDGLGLGGCGRLSGHGCLLGDLRFRILARILLF